MKLFQFIIAICLTISLSGCGTFSHTNTKLDQPIPINSKASFKVLEDRGNHQKTLLILSLSGGGSRAPSV